MGLLPRERIIEATDIVALVGEHVALRRVGKDFVGLCPFHPDKKPSMSVSPTKQIFKCWSCGAGGDAAKFVSMYDKLNYGEALRKLAARANIDVSRDGGDGIAERQREQLRSVMSWAREHFERNLRDARIGRSAMEYARRRGLSDETLNRWRVGLAPESYDDLFTAGRRAGLSVEQLQQAGLVGTSEAGKVYDRFRNRLMFPICDSQGRVIAFGGRALGDDPPKYLNSPESALFSKSRILFGLDLARRAMGNEKSLIVVEGYLDAVMLAQAGFEHVCATMGTALTPIHIRTIKPYCQTVYLCFDSDAAGLAAANRAVELAVESELEVRVVELAGAKDPADLVLEGGAEAFKNFLQTAKDALHFKWAQTVSEYGTGGTQARRTAVEAFLKFIAGVTKTRRIDPIQQGLLVDRLSGLLGVPTADLYEALAAARVAEGRRAVSSSPGEAGEPGLEPESYRSAVAALPAGLVGAVEELLASLTAGPACLAEIDDEMVATFSDVPAWDAVYRAVLDAFEDSGDFDLAALLARIDDPLVLDCVTHVSRRAGAAEDRLAAFLAAKERLVAERSMQRSSEIRPQIRAAGAADRSAEAKFKELLESARRHDSSLPPEYRFKPNSGR